MHLEAALLRFLRPSESNRIPLRNNTVDPPENFDNSTVIGGKNNPVATPQPRIVLVLYYIMIRPRCLLFLSEPRYPHVIDFKELFKKKTPLQKAYEGTVLWRGRYHYSELTVATVSSATRLGGRTGVFFSFFFPVLCFIRLLGTKTSCSASYGKEKPPITNQTVPGKKASTHVPLVWNQPHTSYAK